MEQPLGFVLMRIQYTHFIPSALVVFSQFLSFQ